MSRHFVIAWHFLNQAEKSQRTDCAGLEAVFRIVQSISSPKAEVFKRWLAMAGSRGKKPKDRHTDFDSILSVLGIPPLPQSLGSGFPTPMKITGRRLARLARLLKRRGNN